jgi:penicillin amidase
MRSHRESTWRTWTGRGLAVLVLLVLAAVLGSWASLRASLPQLDGVRPVTGLSAPVTVTRDARGVPLLTADNRVDLAYTTGFLHAQERFFQMDLMRRSGAGELAELFGAKAVPLDRRRRLHRFRARAADMLAALPADERRFLERYADGVNAGLGALGARPFEYALTGTSPRPWQAADCLLVAWAMYFDLQSMQASRLIVRNWVAQHSDAAQAAFLLPASSQWDAPIDADLTSAATAPPLAIPSTAPAWWGAPAKPVPAPSGPQLATAAQAIASDTLAMLEGNDAGKGGIGAVADGVGSNNWAISGSRSADGRAIVSNDMHLGLQLPNTWYRLAMQYRDASGKPRRLVGLTLPGTPPVLLVGSNGHVAWSYTNAYGNFLELLPLDADPARPGSLSSAGTPLAVTTHVEIIKVKGAADERLEVRDTALGPLRTIGGRDYAVHWIAHQSGALNVRHRLLEESDTLAATLAAAAGVGMPAQNFVAGDDQGHIGWTIIGPLPRFLPGAGAGQASWEGVLPPASYPHIIDPPGGQISTANSRQLAGPDAALIGDGGFDLGARNQQIAGALRALGPRTTVAGVYSVTLDDRALFMEGWRQRALAVLDAEALRGQPQRAEFARLLRQSWTGHASTDSVGYRLARAFMWSLYAQAYGAANAELVKLEPRGADMHAASSRWPAVMAQLLDAQPAGWLPSSYPSWRAFQLAAVDRAIADVDAPLASSTWGKRNTAAIAHPITMALPWLKRWLAAPADPLPGDANMPRVAGSAFGQSERFTVSPGKEEEGVFNMPGGQSGHPMSPHFLDGHADWVTGRTVSLLPGAPVHSLQLQPATAK